MINGASAVPRVTSIRAGSVTIALTRPTRSTAFAGTRLLLSFDQCCDPGTARSRLNANSIREADVMHDVAQNSWAEAEMKSTNVAQSLPRDCKKMYATPPAPTPALSG